MIAMVCIISFLPRKMIFAG